MKCSYCQTLNDSVLPFRQPVDGGRAFARTCINCGHILSVRPRTDDDPPVIPQDLTPVQLERLRFVQWRLRGECTAQITVSEDGPSGSPLSAA